MMKPFHAAICLTMALVGCGPLNTNYKEGVSVATLNRDQTACDVAALRDVPVATQIRRLPPEYIPPLRRCKKNGDCVVIPGYWLPGEIVTYDANARLRARAAQQCMSAKGYTRVSIPPCPGNVAQSAPVAATTRLPRLTPTTCVIRNRDGSVQIVQTRG